MYVHLGLPYIIISENMPSFQSQKLAAGRVLLNLYNCLGYFGMLLRISMVLDTKETYCFFFFNELLYYFPNIKIKHMNSAVDLRNMLHNFGNIRDFSLPPCA